MSGITLQALCYIVVLSATVQTEVSAKNLVVASYNLWNVMFQWDVRKYFIAEMIRESDADIVGLQEVRVDENGERSQLEDLQQLLPEYKFSAYQPTTTIKNKFGAKAISGWEQEGLGVLSKHSIVMSHQIPLSKANKNDQMPRLLLQTQIEFDLHEIFFIVVHFSTDRRLQCQNALRVINFVASTGADRTVIAGDFNTYNDFDWPIEAVKNGFFLPNGCPSPDSFEPMGEDQGYGFRDAWPETNGMNKKGFTFSNMPSPGLINRPDRIFISAVGLDPVKTTLLGKGDKYLEQYSTWSHISRMQTIIHMAKQQWSGKEIAYTCHLDCGPHGSCRCGVCVGGGDQQSCDLSSCSECTASHYTIVFFLYLSISTYIIGIIYVSVGLWAKYSKRRRLKQLFVCSWFGCKHMIVFTLAGMLVFYIVIKVAFVDMIALALNRTPEEMYPSDHLMVVSEIKMSYH